MEPQYPADDGAMDHGTMTNGSTPDMSGMMTPEQMGQLSSTSGAAFDRMFLQMMIAHHQSAVSDAQKEQAEGVNDQAKALASNIVTSQTEEIKRMQQLRQTL